MKNALLTILTAVLFLPSQAQNIKEFQSPPNAAKPRVWWHWMNGNVTKDGIQKDLDWMEKTGIGGFQNFDANLFTPVVVPQKLVFMDKNWKDAFKFTTELADKKGLEMAIAGSPGWSVTGGPWVEPKDAMKKYVWTETRITGGQSFSGKLPQPSGALSNFQNVELADGGITGGFVGTKPNFYQDAAVIAFRIAKSEKPLVDFNPKVTSSGGNFNLKSLTDSDLNTVTKLPPKEVGEDMWIQYEFETPQTFKALSVVGAVHGTLEQFRGSPENRSLKVSDDGVNFREITRIHGSAVPQTSVSFPATTANYFRFCYQTLAGQPDGIAAMMGGNTGPIKPSGVNVAEFVLYNTDRIDKFEDKAGFLPWKEDTKSFMPSGSDVISAEDIIDITDKMQADGTLNWTAPAGDWGVLRFGYSLTGRQNHPASPEATGFEVDKLDKDAVKKYINTYLDMYKDATGGLMGVKGLQYMILDSYEAGHMNWTKTFQEDFQTRRGYDIKKWIPVLAGRVVKSVEESEKFLWDFRKTIGEMIAENHYDVIGEELHKRGMKRYTESHEGGRIYLADGMDVKRNAEVPMSAMWTPGSLAGGENEEVRSEADIREAASVANIYGQNIVAAESMTAIQNAFSWHPEKLKRTADLEMASGLNRFVIHTSVHQPLDKGPGFSLGPFGQYFSRLETWSGAGAKAWITYLGRSSYMLQQGKNVADILYYYGENTNVTWISRESLPKIPKGIEFDYVNASILKEDIKPENGYLIAPSGNSYKILMLDSSAKEMTLDVLKKINALQLAGVNVAGQKPEMSPSLNDNVAEYLKLAEEVASKMVSIESLNLAPDVSISGTEHKILFRHRKADNGDIYWLNNRNEAPTEAIISFNISEKTPKLWNAETGEVSDLNFSVKNGRTDIKLALKSWDAIFIVFGNASPTTILANANTTLISQRTLEGDWEVDFDGMQKEMNTLVSWTENEDTKHFSGTVDYTFTFNQNKKIKKGEQYILEIQDLKNLAEVVLNGQNLGVIWKKPYEINITKALKKGDNELELKVTNTWVNKLIGDSAKSGEEKETFTTMPFYRPDVPLVPAGIIGEVKVMRKIIK